MNNKKIMIVVFVAICLVQLAIPGSLIFQQENVIATGKLYKFKTAPVDPSDPFRGKYITLNFNEAQFPINDKEKWRDIRDVFVIIENDSAGFARIHDVVTIRPKNEVDFVEAKISYINYNEPPELMIDFPFTRYYMEESKAGDAEILYNTWQRDSSIVTYADVRVKNGISVLTDVIIDGKSIKDKVKEKPVSK